MDGMSMSGMTMLTSSATTDTMASMASATSSMSSSSSTTTMMGMDEMAMTFFTSTNTPLYSSAWTPNSTGQYAGTCIFLIAFAAIFRALLAVRINFFQVLTMVEHRRNEALPDPSMVDAKPTTLTTYPWRVKEAVLIASIDVILAGTSYLLMIAVMTMNVGYFLSILAGIFVGGMVFGRFMAQSASH